MPLLPFLPCHGLPCCPSPALPDQGTLCPLWDLGQLCVGTSTGSPCPQPAMGQGRTVRKPVLHDGEARLMSCVQAACVRRKAILYIGDPIFGNSLKFKKCWAGGS